MLVSHGPSLYGRIYESVLDAKQPGRSLVRERDDVLVLGILQNFYNLYVVLHFSIIFVFNFRLLSPQFFCTEPGDVVRVKFHLEVRGRPRLYDVDGSVDYRVCLVLSCAAKQL